MTGKLKKEVEDIVCGMGYDTYESDGHSDFAVRDILIKFAEPREGRIAELEKENTELRRVAEFQQSSNMSRYFDVKKLDKAKEIITALLNVFVGDIPEEDLDVGQIDVREKAEKFLKEVSE